MMHFFNVGARAGNACGDFRKCAGQVADLHSKSCKLTGPYTPAFYDLREHEQIDVAAAQDKSHVLTAEAMGRFDQCSEAGPTGAFGDRFFDVKQEDNRFLKRAFADK